MKTLFFECGMGAAGDMLTAALLDLLPDQDGFISRMNRIGIPGVRMERNSAVKCGITGNHVTVLVNGEEEHSHDYDHGDHHHHDHEDHDHHNHDEHHSHEENHEHSHGDHVHSDHDHGHAHHHASMEDIETLIQNLSVSDWVKRNAIGVYHLIAAAESKAHGKDVSEIHFHEVGTLDAVTDIVGVCMLIEELAPDHIYASPIHVGAGHVHCAHGVLPVPAPATAHILMGVPTFGGRIQGELCTPTGAALVKHFAEGFGGMPVMTVTGIGYGMGNKEFEMANCVRVFAGETDEAAGANEEIAELSCNLDDMTGEAVGFARELLLSEGALDVYTIPVQMKKNRPAQILTCLCKKEDCDRIAGLILKHTSTFGVRKTMCSRYALERKRVKVSTRFGEINVKKGCGYGVEKWKPEFEDMAAAARQNNVTLEEVARDVVRQMKNE
ncbi:nickel pincer cofactor biosynthesis protein LarC [Anaerolentibacter hominis]|uniref:nickel pincer cofactor biosynthesis protein LarC n=1 Tax=Anaerolentibacter hominis TaxID=3079009 RepID=UPI0031B88C97